MTTAEDRETVIVRLGLPATREFCALSAHYVTTQAATKLKTKRRVLSPRANYTDRATAVYRLS
jgi:hypothetical protein